MIQRMKPNILKKEYPYIQISDHLLPKSIIWMNLLEEKQHNKTVNKPHYYTILSNYIIIQDPKLATERIQEHEERKHNQQTERTKRFERRKTCSYKKNIAVENVFAAQPTIPRVESGSKYIKTHSAIINVGKLITTSE